MLWTDLGHTLALDQFFFVQKQFSHFVQNSPTSKEFGLTAKCNPV
jgi:hypothetical protein